MHSKAVSHIIMGVILFSAACSPQRAALTLDVTAPVAKATLPPTAASSPNGELTVLAAASLTESFTELGKIFETQHPGVKVTLGFAGSQQLAQQLSQGVQADVFASASQKYMDAAVDTGRVKPGSAVTFANNRLVVIYPKDNPAGIVDLLDLANPGVLLDLADKTVPAGQYSLDFLDKAVKNSAYGSDYKEKVLANVVSYEDKVKSVVTKVSLGEADAGIVYVTDITAPIAKTILTLEIPDALNTIASYYIAPVADSQVPDLAQAFVDLVLSGEGQAVLSRYGFIPALH